MIEAALAKLATFADVALAFVIASFFGLIRYLQDFLGSDPPAFRWVIAIAKVVTAGSAGMLVHWLVVEWKVSGNYGAFLIAVAGYGGAEFINAVKEGALEYIRRKASSPRNLAQRTRFWSGRCIRALLITYVGTVVALSVITFVVRAVR